MRFRTSWRLCPSESHVFASKSPSWSLSSLMFGGSVAHRFPGLATPDRNTQPVLRAEVAHALRPEAREAWRDLVRRAVRPNVFMEPAFVHATAHTKGAGAATSRYILVWDSAGGLLGARLLGVWAFVLGRANAG